MLQPTPWRPSNFAAISKQKIKIIFTKGMQKIKDFGEWLLNYIPPKSKVVDKVLKSLKTKLNQFRKREIVCSNQHKQICFEEFCD